MLPFLNQETPMAEQMTYREGVGSKNLCPNELLSEEEFFSNKVIFDGLVTYPRLNLSSESINRNRLHDVFIAHQMYKFCTYLIV